MGQDGLTAVSNPSEIFLREHGSEGASSAVTVTMEGTRPLLLEVQALCSPAYGVRHLRHGILCSRHTIAYMQSSAPCP